MDIYRIYQQACKSKILAYELAYRTRPADGYFVFSIPGDVTIWFNNIDEFIRLLIRSSEAAKHLAFDKSIRSSDNIILLTGVLKTGYTDRYEYITEDDPKFVDIIDYESFTNSSAHKKVITQLDIDRYYRHILEVLTKPKRTPKKPLTGQLTTTRKIIRRVQTTTSQPTAQSCPRTSEERISEYLKNYTFEISPELPKLPVNADLYKDPDYANLVTIVNGWSFSDADWCVDGSGGYQQFSRRLTLQHLFKRVDYWKRTRRNIVENINALVFLLIQLFENWGPYMRANRYPDGGKNICIDTSSLYSEYSVNDYVYQHQQTIVPELRYRVNNPQRITCNLDSQTLGPHVRFT